MANILFVEPIDVAERTPLGGNIDVTKYTEIIKECQTFIIEPILGTKLYEKLLTDYDGGTLTGLYETIVNDYLKNILVYTVAAEYIIIASYNVANGGIFKHLPQNGEPVNKTEVDYLAEKQRQKADVYLQRLGKFLCDKANEIPEYTSAQDENYDEKPRKNKSYTGGWFLDEKYNGRHKDAMYYLMKDIYNDN